MDDVRVEAEVGYHHNDIDKILGFDVDDCNLSMWTFMANAYYDIPTKSSVTPYIMGGLGLADATLDIGGAKSSSSQFAWQLGSGIGIKATDTVTIDLGYRYLKPSEGDFDGSKVTLGGSEILAGIRCSF